MTPAAIFGAVAGAALVAAGAAPAQEPARAGATPAPPPAAAPPAPAGGQPGELRRLGRPMPANVPPIPTRRAQREPPRAHVSAVSPSASRFSNRLRAGDGGRRRTSPGAGTAMPPDAGEGATAGMDAE